MGAITSESGEDFVKGFKVTPPKSNQLENLTLRSCLRDPIPEIYQAAHYLDAAVSAHLGGRLNLAEELIHRANMPVIREWTESVWGSNSRYVKYRAVLEAPPTLSKDQRVQTRMPTPAEKHELHWRDGYHCRFCGMPVITREIRNAIREAYGEALPWGSTNREQHAAFQAMWLQYDHLMPHTRGGKNDLENIVITCAPCNFGRMNYTLEEIGLLDPRTREAIRSSWDGLERFSRR